MPRYVSGWLNDVISEAYNRGYISRTRRRPIYVLISSIMNAKVKGINPIIAEYKRKSPSGLDVNRDPVEYATFMERNGAVALSVVTEPKYFGGSYEVLEKIAQNVRIPILFKDFVVTEEQVDTAYNLGADAVLLIARILTKRELCDLYDYVLSYNMTPLIEVHDEGDLEMALSCDPKILGVNARDLNSLEVSVDKASELLKKVPEGIVRVAESGVTDKDKLLKLKESGADAFLIGTALMRDPEKIKELIG